LLVVDELTVRYGKSTAVRGISLRVDEGEVVGLIGSNGAGKTTTLSSIFGLVPAAEGSVAFEGRSLLGLAPETIVRLGVALVPEGRHIFGTLTVAENLSLGATARTDRTTIARETDRLCQLFPVLGKYLDVPASRLSGGEQQQLAIARALLAKPRLLLLDEPSLGLAPLVIDLVFSAMAELRDEGVTLLLVEQNAARTVAFADRTYVLRTGRVAAEGSSDELAATIDLAHAYLGV
jgi:branched-chain amino acid transport system ATP-binding protein